MKKDDQCSFDVLPSDVYSKHTISGDRLGLTNHSVAITRFISSVYPQ
jgi:hypothetical protein